MYNSAGLKNEEEKPVYIQLVAHVSSSSGGKNMKNKKQEKEVIEIAKSRRGRWMEHILIGSTY
jgi:hypothetical protein